MPKDARFNLGYFLFALLGLMLIQCMCTAAPAGHNYPLQPV